jgi:hypothetical protein
LFGSSGKTENSAVSSKNSYLQVEQHHSMVQEVCHFARCTLLALCFFQCLAQLARLFAHLLKEGYGNCNFKTNAKCVLSQTKVIVMCVIICLLMCTCSRQQCCFTSGCAFPFTNYQPSAQARHQVKLQRRYVRLLCNKRTPPKAARGKERIS